MGILVEVHCRVRMCARFRDRKHARHVRSNEFLKGNTTQESAEVDENLSPKNDTMSCFIHNGHNGIINMTN